MQHYVVGGLLLISAKAPCFYLIQYGLVLSSIAEGQEQCYVPLLRIPYTYNLSEQENIPTGGFPLWAHQNNQDLMNAFECFLEMPVIISGVS
jgi:hypothetical protein